MKVAKPKFRFGNFQNFCDKATVQELCDKISSEWRSFGSKEHTKETKIAESVLLSLFMCSNVMMQHCSRPLAPASAENYFQTDSEWAQMIPKDQKISNLHYDDVRGDVLRSPQGITPAAVKIK